MPTNYRLERTMTRPYRFLLSTVDKPFTVAEAPEAVAVESDFIVILAALLCAMICVVGLIALARCAWQRRGSVDNGSWNPDQRSPEVGMKKKMIEVLPKFDYDSDHSGKLSCTECAICLSEYVTGDEIRVLPVCGHGFHVECVDKWLISQSSCPSCRQVLVSTKCKTCGEFPTVSIEAEEKCRHHSSSSSSSSSSDYLP